jgi:hypothetical protein
MFFRHLTRSVFQFAKRTNINQRLYSSIQQQQQYRKFEITQRYFPIRTFSSVQTNDNAYRDLDTFLQKEIQLEKTAQKHPSKLPTISDFQVYFYFIYFSFFHFSLGTKQWSRSNINSTNG